MKSNILDETEEIKRGQLLAEVLRLRKEPTYKDRYQTEWGSKTALGLYRTVKRIIEDGE